MNIIGYITSKTGAVINGKKVDRETFFNTLNKWGKGNERFVVLHHSILSEGINVSGLEEHCFLDQWIMLVYLKLLVE